MAAQICAAEIAWQGDPRVRRFQEEMARRRSEEARRIGDRMAALRERHHLTQEAAATKLKVAYRTYQSWEQGTSVPRWAMRERVAKFYKVPVEEINGPALPSEDVLERIEEKLTEVAEDLSALRGALLGDEEDAQAVAGVAARLLQAAGLLQPPADGQPAKRPAVVRPPRA